MSISCDVVTQETISDIVCVCCVHSSIVVFVVFFVILLLFFCFLFCCSFLGGGEGGGTGGGWTFLAYRSILLLDEQHTELGNRRIFITTSGRPLGTLSKYTKIGGGEASSFFCRPETGTADASHHHHHVLKAIWNKKGWSWEGHVLYPYSESFLV